MTLQTDSIKLTILKRDRPASRKGVTLTPCPPTQQRNLSGVFMQKIITRSEAIQQGLKHYFTGKPCKRGHVTTRKVSDKACRDCCRINQQNRRKDPKIVALERVRQREKWAWCSETRDRKKRSDKERRSSDEFKLRQREIDREKYRLNAEFRNSKIRRSCDYSKNNRHKINERNRSWFKRKYRSDREFKISHNIRSMLNRVILACESKKSANTFDALGYSADEFKVHMELQFAKGMSWDNHGEWHIDHIVPVSWHVKNGETDPKVINSLTNLRPIWASENISKGNSLVVFI